MQQNAATTGGQDDEINIKTVVVGEGAVGKTCMIMSYCQDKFPTSYQPTVFDTYKGVSKYDKMEVNLQIWDTAGQNDFGRVRPLAYNGCNVFLVCFSLVDRNSFETAISKWLPEVTTLGPLCPTILVGTKSDLKEQYEKDPIKKSLCVSYDEGRSKAKEQNFFSYQECSAKTQENLIDVFHEAMKAVFTFREKSAQNAKPTVPEKKKDKGGMCSVL